MGFTASKKVGGAVLRNRAKRRLRALADAVAPQQARPGWDYVLIARAETTAQRDFSCMQNELAEAFERVHSAKAQKSGGRRGPGARGGRPADTAS